MWGVGVASSIACKWVSFVAWDLAFVLGIGLPMLEDGSYNPLISVLSCDLLGYILGLQRYIYYLAILCSVHASCPVLSRMKKATCC